MPNTDLALSILAIQNAVCIAVAFSIVIDCHVCQSPALPTPTALYQRCCTACEHSKCPQRKQLGTHARCLALIASIFGPASLQFCVLIVNFGTN